MRNITHLRRIWEEGYAAYALGLTCPYTDGEQVDAWEDGFITAKLA